MYNWSVDIKQLKKHPEKAIVWKLEQTINYGLNGEKLDIGLTRKYWNRLCIDPARKKFLKFILWPRKS